MAATAAHPRPRTHTAPRATTGQLGTIVPLNRRDPWAQKMVSMQTIWLVCRTQGHCWPTPSSKTDKFRFGATERPGVYEIEEFCDRDGMGCGVSRIRYGQRVGQDGFAIDHSASRYNYPPGYLFREDDGYEYDRDRVRGELYRRQHVMRERILWPPNVA